MTQNPGMPTYCERCGYDQNPEFHGDEYERRVVLAASIGKAHLPVCMDCLLQWEALIEAPRMQPAIRELGIKNQMFQLAISGEGILDRSDPILDLLNADVELAIKVATEYAEADRFFDQVAMGFINGADYDILLERAGGAKTP